MRSFETRSLSAPTAELAEALLREGMEIQIRLSGWSMRPLVPSGSVLRFSGAGSPVLGDVVLTRLSNDSLVAHRVIALDCDRIWTKGDACRTADGPVSRERVIGRAVRLEGPLPLPLGNRVMRVLGLVLNRLYPRVVGAYRAVFPRALEQEAGG